MKLCEKILSLVKRISIIINDLRKEGLQAPLGNTLNFVCWSIMNDFGILRRVKEYSTPFAMKSISRISIFLLPIF